MRKGERGREKKSEKEGGAERKWEIEKEIERCIIRLLYFHF